MTVSGPDRAVAVTLLEKEGHSVVCADSPKDAKRLMAEKLCDVLLYEWYFGDQIFWIRRKFTAVMRNPNVNFEQFLPDLKQALANILRR